MGLRIIDRKPKSKPVLTPNDPGARDELLLRAALQWGHAMGGDDQQRQTEFMAKIRSIRARLTTAADAKTIASELEVNIRNGSADATKSQGLIDPDTLLELL